MELLYTGSTRPKGPQEIPSESLGGYVSSTPVPSDWEGNVFSTLTHSALAMKMREVRCLVLNNNGTINFTDVSLFIDIPEDAKYMIKAGISEVGLDDCNDQVVAKVTDQRKIPTFLPLHDVNGELNKISLGAMAPGQAFAIWFVRDIRKDIPVFPTPQELYDQYKAETKIEDIEHTLDLVIQTTI